MYWMKFDAAAATIRLQLTGLWTPEVMSAFRKEFVPLVDASRRLEPRCCILSDCRNYPVQSAAVMDGWIELLGPNSAYSWPPYAVVAGSVLNKLQAQRALTAPNVAVFSDLAEAEDWLAAQP